ncbi:MAG: S8 family serine peptidase [candidate division KSB1 bacterium]|jgi:subtilisin family serine protease|nr:S8 family serine peptidase [candidate division KSB1 bacterium]
MTPSLRIIVMLMMAVFMICDTASLFPQKTNGFSPRDILVKIKPEKKAIHRVLSIVEGVHKPMQSLPLFKDHEGALGNIYKIIVRDSSDILDLLSRLNQDPAVEYAHLNHIYQVDYLPDDPLLDQQWIVSTIGLAEAWEIERGSGEVLVAIIDTGIDDSHDDLMGSIWINPGEDVNGNGVFDSVDVNGVDDDGNGYIDDIKGWDFTDAPSFPDGGDYLGRDNDPSDEHGHGTSVAGIVGANGDNGYGIAGVAYDCPLLNLRAGTSQGLLEEDDVASAIVYAVDNGAAVINMSFGDVVASPLLQDVMRYAHSRDVVMVASAGNSASDAIHYPSAFNETISVGATTIDDVLASFSNWGATIDAVAPGVDLLTTKLNDQYGLFSGTSAAAPVVSGIAALLKSRHPQLTNEDIRNIIVSTTDDLGPADWDRYYAAGRVHAGRALRTKIASEAKIAFPELDDGFALSPIVISGTASGAYLARYELYYGFGENPVEWFLFDQKVNRQVLEDTLGIWDCSDLPDSSYTVRLKVRNKDGSSVEHRTRIFIDRSPPVSYELRVTPMIDGPSPSALIDYMTDDLCRSWILYRPFDSQMPFEEVQLKYRTKEHHFNFDLGDEQNRFEYIIALENMSGLKSQTDVIVDPLLDLSADDIRSDAFAPAEFILPSGFMLNALVDFDDDGKVELIINEYRNVDAFGKLKIYEYDDAEFRQVFESTMMLIPRDTGDSDGDGLREILAGSGARSYIIESSSGNGYPDKIVWEDSSGFWASRYFDLDGDGRTEIIGRTDDIYVVRENTGDNTFVEIASLSNPTSGSNTYGVPHTEAGDFDNDGRMEILIGDSDGDVYIYESDGDNIFVPVWNERQPLEDCTDFIASGDYDGDGVPEFAVGSHSSFDLDAEHEYDSRHWIVRIYNSISDNTYKIAWQQAFYGLGSDNGFSSGDVDNDDLKELILNLFPDLYVVDYDVMNDAYALSFYDTPTNSQANIVGDVDADGINELFVNRGDRIVSYVHTGDVPSSQPYPSHFDVWPLDTNQVHLQWNVSDAAEYYLIYRAFNRDSLMLYQATAGSSYLDTLVEKGVIYYYSVRAVSNDDTSRFAPLVSAIPGDKPYIQDMSCISSRQLRMTFSESMAHSIVNLDHYRLEPGQQSLTSVVTTKSNKEIVLTLDKDLLPGEYSITVENVMDSDRTPIDTTRNSFVFRAQGALKKPYLVRASQLSSHRIQLVFSQEMDSISVTDRSNYAIEPDISVTGVDPDPVDSKIVLLILDDSESITALGFSYLITVRNVKSRDGIAIGSGQGSQASIFLFREDLSGVFTYPNPFRYGDADYLMFANLTQEAEIRIMTLEGIVIRTIFENDGNGGVEWDLKDNTGTLVPSGIYLYQVQGNGQRKTGKLAIVR